MGGMMPPPSSGEMPVPGVPGAPSPPSSSNEELDKINKGRFQGSTGSIQGPPGISQIYSDTFILICIVSYCVVLNAYMNRSTKFEKIRISMYFYVYYVFTFKFISIYIDEYKYAHMYAHIYISLSMQLNKVHQQ